MAVRTALMTGCSYSNKEMVGYGSMVRMFVGVTVAIQVVQIIVGVNVDKNFLQTRQASGNNV